MDITRLHDGTVPNQLLSLAGAILIGADKRPQGRGGFFRRAFDGTLTACALGAAWEALYPAEMIGAAPEWLTDADSDLQQRICDGLEQAWPALEDFSRPWGCPVTGCWHRADITLFQLIGHLNDDHEWTRERIAKLLCQQSYAERA